MARASAAVGRLKGSGFSSVLIKFLARDPQTNVSVMRGMGQVVVAPSLETFFQYLSWNSIFAAIVSRISSFGSSDLNGA